MKRKGIQCPSCGAYAFRMTFINMEGDGSNRLAASCNKCNHMIQFVVGVSEPKRRLNKGRGVRFNEGMSE